MLSMDNFWTTYGEGMKSNASFVAGHTSCSLVWNARPVFRRKFVMMIPTTTCPYVKRSHPKCQPCATWVKPSQVSTMCHIPTNILPQLWKRTKHAAKSKIICVSVQSIMQMMIAGPSSFTKWAWSEHHPGDGDGGYSTRIVIIRLCERSHKAHVWRWRTWDTKIPTIKISTTMYPLAPALAFSTGAISLSVWLKRATKSSLCAHKMLLGKRLQIQNVCIQHVTVTTSHHTDMNQHRPLCCEQIAWLSTPKDSQASHT